MGKSYKLLILFVGYLVLQKPAILPLSWILVYKALSVATNVYQGCQWRLHFTSMLARRGHTAPEAPRRKIEGGSGDKLTLELPVKDLELKFSDGYLSPSSQILLARCNQSVKSHVSDLAEHPLFTS